MNKQDQDERQIIAAFAFGVFLTSLEWWFVLGILK